jgi:hypothetical protein
MYNKKSKTTMSITFNMYTQKALEHHESKSKLHVLISELLYMGSSTQLYASSLLYALFSIYKVSNVTNDTI